MTAVFSFLILGERLTMTGITGALIILACVAAETLPSDHVKREGACR